MDHEHRSLGGLLLAPTGPLSDVERSLIPECVHVMPTLDVKSWSGASSRVTEVPLKEK